MSYLFYHTMQDNVGNLLFDVSGTMRLAGTSTLATIYGDPGLGVILPNPMMNHPSYGSFKCYMSAGNYDFYMAKAGYSFETLTGIQADGTLAQQDATNVNVDNLTVDFAAQMNNLGVGTPADGAYSIKAAFDSLFQANVQIAQALGLGTAPVPGKSLVAAFPAEFQGDVQVGRLGIGIGVDSFLSLVAGFGAVIRHDKASRHGLTMRPTDADTGPGSEINFNNIAGASIGTITTTATATAYNTSSDARLKKNIAPLTGALDVVQALRPVHFLWKADGSPGRGFLAGEVQDVIPDGVITGERGAMDDEGKVLPQMIDMSKLVPYLTAAVKELAQQVTALTARLEAAGA